MQTQQAATVSNVAIHAPPHQVFTVGQFAKRTGIDFEDVAAFAEVDTDIDGKPIPGLVEEYREIFGVRG